MDTTHRSREDVRRQPGQTGQKRPAGAQSPQRRRPAAAQNSQPRPDSQRKESRQGAAQPRPRPTAPQGTGPRKSAPQPGVRETAAAKRAPVKTQTNTQRTAKKNSLQNFISGIRGGSSREKEERSAQAQERRRKRAEAAARKKKQAQRYDTPAVIYTAPQPFNRNRLLVQLMTVAAVVAALIMGLSVFFKVETITVSGAEKYSTWAVREASGIEEGANLLTFSIPRASGKIMAELPYVDKVRIGIKLPDTVNIYIEELDVAYAIKDSTGTWWLMTSDGKMVEQTDSGTAAGHTQVLGVAVENPAKNERAVAAEAIPTETGEDGQLIPVTVTGAQRLSSALQILKALEANDIVGEAASVDVTRLEDIILWYGTRYQVNLGDVNNMNHNMEYKIACMNDTILQLSEYETGVLDITFTTFPDQVAYTPFT